MLLLTLMLPQVSGWQQITDDLVLTKHGENHRACRGNLMYSQLQGTLLNQTDPVEMVLGLSPLFTTVFDSAGSLDVRPADMYLSTRAQCHRKRVCS